MASGFDNEDLVDEAIGVGHAGNIVKRYKDQKDLQHSGKTFPLSWQTNEDTVRTYVENNCTKYDKKAQNASLTRENGAFNFVAGTEGLEPFGTMLTTVNLSPAMASVK